MRELVIITDLGRLRVFRFQPAGDDPREKDHLVEESSEDLKGVGAPMRDTVSDQAGRFGGGGGAGATGEEHNLEGELERQALERVAERIAAVVESTGRPGWLLVAPQSILKRLTEALPSSCRETLGESMAADLTKVPVAKLEERFLK